MFVELLSISIRLIKSSFVRTPVVFSQVSNRLSSVALSFPVCSLRKAIPFSLIGLFNASLTDLSNNFCFLVKTVLSAISLSAFKSYLFELNPVS